MDSVKRDIFIAAPRARVWRALTGEFGEWFRVELTSGFAVGEVTEGPMTMPGAEGLPFRARTEVMEPPRRFVFTWPQWDFEKGVNLDGVAPWTRVEFVLAEEAGGTRVTVTESGFEALPEGVGARVLSENTQGWEIQLGNLKDHVGGGHGG